MLNIAFGITWLQDARLLSRTCPVFSVVTPIASKKCWWLILHELWKNVQIKCQKLLCRSAGLESHYCILGRLLSKSYDVKQLFCQIMSCHIYVALYHIKFRRVTVPVINIQIIKSCRKNNILRHQLVNILHSFNPYYKTLIKQYYKITIKAN